MRISREKLSYIVDSTAAPDAGLALVSTWVVFEVTTFAPQLKAVGVTDDPYSIFLRTMPYRFYCLFTLFLVYASILLRRDFGPMLAAERRAGSTGKVIRDGGTPLAGARAMAVAEKPGVPRRWWNAALPLAVMIFGSLFEMVRIGRANVTGPVDLGSLSGLRQVLAGTSSAEALFHGSILSWLTAAVLMLGQRILSWREVGAASLRAASGITLALSILFLAWAIGGVTSDLGTAQVLVALFKSSMPPFLLPILLFLISCAVSFATGTSWGTMAIVLPNTVILAYTLGENFAGGPLGLTILSIGAVLEGSIFGDHCSPVSDTTIFSSMSTGSDHLDHVRTQMPYAILAMLVALLIGYLPAAAIGLHPAVSLVAGALTLVGFLLLRGGDPDLGRVEPGAEGGAR
jgi:Na+/H+ antiporter NhaC